MTRRQRHVALLRGINVGGRNRLAMSDLRAIFEAAGGREVRTYIQSGNVVFEASAERAGRIPADVTQSIAKELGLNVPVVTRTAQRFLETARGHVFGGDGIEDKLLGVAYLAKCPTKKLAETIDPDAFPPDRIALRGSEIYYYFPNGTARTKFTTAYFDRRLDTTSTARNWKTIGRIAEMLRA